jgi:hypothetical protein
MKRAAACVLLSLGACVATPPPPSVEPRPLEDQPLVTRTERVRIETEPGAATPLEAALQPARERVARCLPTSSGKLEIVVTRYQGGSVQLSIAPSASLDPTARDCVLEALSTVDIEQAGGSVGGPAIPPTGYTSLIRISW